MHHLTNSNDNSIGFYSDGVRQRALNNLIIAMASLPTSTLWPFTAVCIMIDRVQKWAKCNFPSPLIGIHGQQVSGFPWFESTGKFKCGNCSILRTFALLHYRLWYHSLKNNLQPVKKNIWGTPQGLRLVYSVDTVVNLLCSLAWIFRLLLRGSWFVSIYTIVVGPPPTRSRQSRPAETESHILLIFATDLSLCKLL